MRDPKHSSLVSKAALMLLITGTRGDVSSVARGAGSEAQIVDCERSSLGRVAA